MKHHITVLFFFILFILSYSPASDATIDSTRIYKADDVVVTATRTAVSFTDTPSPVHIISAGSIRQIDAKTVADVLRSINSVSIKDYGAAGGTKNVTLRGLSTENVLLLFNGVPINDSQYGSMDLNLLPLDAVDRIEVSYGGSSALYGGNALSGVVNILPRYASDDIHARAQFGGGSFDARRTAVEIEGRPYGIGIIGGAARETGDDNFPFIWHRQNQSDTTLYRQNADYKRTNIFLNSDYHPVENLALNASIQYVDIERGVPGSINYPSPARQSDESFRVMLGSRLNLNSDLIFSLNGIYNRNDEIYKEPVEFMPTDLLYKSNSYMINSQIEWSPISWDRIVGGIEYNESRLDVEGISWGMPFIMNPARVQKSVYISNEILYNNNSDWFDRVSLYLTGRYDYYSDVIKDAFSPKLGINIRINRQYNVHLRSSYGKNFRVPTFNDLYYPMYSNPGVTSERSTAFDIGLIGDLDQSGAQKIQLTFFDILTRDKIVYTADYKPYNIGEADNAGIEIWYDYHSLDGKIQAFFGFTLIDAVKKNRASITDSTYDKQLPYVPKSLGSFGLSVETYIGRISIIQSVTSIRYTNADNSSSLPAYSLTDLNFSREIQVRPVMLTLQCGVSNIFDTDYQAVEGYPMYGRSYKIAIVIDY